MGSRNEPTDEGVHVCMLTGYYPKGAAPKSNQKAQEDLIDETLKVAGVTGAKAVRRCPCLKHM